MAHSTGGLITSLYLADTQNQDSIRGFILNSPFFDFNFSKIEEAVVLPLLVASAGLFPNKVISGTSKTPNLYSQSLLARYHGLWDYDTRLKKDCGHPIRLSWVRAIVRGHKRVQHGLQLPMPILLMSSDKSIRAKGDWQEAFGKADLVLDVEDIQRYGQRLGPHVEAHQIPNGLHDLFLSSDTTAYKAAYRTLFSFLDSLHSPLQP